MTINNIRLLAANKYNDVNTLPKGGIGTESFSGIVNNIFNSYSKMSPGEILASIKGDKNLVTSSAPPVQFVSSLKSGVAGAENTIRKSLIKEASLVDLMATTKSAQHTVNKIVTIKNEFLKSFNKIMDMTV